MPFPLFFQLGTGYTTTIGHAVLPVDGTRLLPCIQEGMFIASLPGLWKRTLADWN